MSKSVDLNGRRKDGLEPGGTVDIELGGPDNRDLTARYRLLVSLLGFLLISSLLYIWNAEIAEDERVEATEWKVVDDSQPTIPPQQPASSETTIPVQDPTVSPIAASSIEEIESPIPDSMDEQCSDICDKRETNRKTKFGGDLLDPKEVLRLAKAARDETITSLRNDYGNYFDGIFVKPPDNNNTDPNQEPSYYSMEGATPDGPSRGRLKRKLKLKVLKMMKSIRTVESNVNGCDCMKKTGTPDGPFDDASMETPDYYEKYVFANGGHSQAAGHGNKFNESYTAYFGRDVETVWGAIGVETAARNMGMGAMQASPDIATCSKEIFGDDIDILAWNYAMTDKAFNSAAYYVYRGATNPGRPALVFMTWNSASKIVEPFEEQGLAMFTMNDSTESLKNVPDSEPNGIPKSVYETKRMPPYVRTLKCNNKMGGKDLCASLKWSCTEHMQEAGIQCSCPHVGKRSSWHMGYQMHALHGHYMSLPFLEILMEGLHELSTSAEDTQVLLEELQKEEDDEFETFLSMPVLNRDKYNIDGVFGPGLGEIDGELMETWFKGPSICRTSLLPAMSRYLGLTTNTNATGGPAPCGKETYDIGIPFNRNGGDYVYMGNHTPPPGDFSIVAANDFRSCFSEEECPVTIMPDYKDWFLAEWEDKKASITFPNEKEKSHYGYEKGKFKGVLGIIPTMFEENVRGQDGPIDIPIGDFQKHVKMTVNGKRVAKYRVFNHMAILQDETGSVYWEPSANSDYLLEFEVVGRMEDGILAAEKHLRLQGFVLY